MKNNNNCPHCGVSIYSAPTPGESLSKEAIAYAEARAAEKQRQKCVPEEPVSEGTRIAVEARSACNDLTEEERKRYASLAEDVLKLHRPDEGNIWVKHKECACPKCCEEMMTIPNRQLPVQKTGYCEPAPECPNCKNNTMVWQEKDFYNHWVCHRAGCGRPVGKPNQEDIPLEKEISYLEINASRVADIHTHVILIDCIKYLRNEIQKLKKI
jgi:ribosomal protein S27AE